jgi:hypothetical protein
MEKTWERAWLMVLALVVWMVLYTLTMAWGIQAGCPPDSAWAPAAVGAVFTVLLEVRDRREVRRG